MRCNDAERVKYGSKAKVTKFILEGESKKFLLQIIMIFESIDLVLAKQSCNLKIKAGIRLLHFKQEILCIEHMLK